MLNLQIITLDPFNVLKSTKPIVENSKYVSIEENRLKNLVDKILERAKKGIFNLEEDYGSTDNLENDLQLIFIENSVNFCFWAEKDKSKWQVEGQKNIMADGWYALKTCFERALAEKVPILDAHYLSSISLDEVKNFFRSKNRIEVPLLKERMANLREAGEILLLKFQGQFINAVEASHWDAVELVNTTIANFPSFRDISKIDSKEIFFLKRAQINSSDADYGGKRYGRRIKNLDQLTAFADYKLPQIFRHFGILKYSHDLTEKIDNFVELPHDSQSEIEIRSATIWVVELLRQLIKTMNSRDIDNTIWLMSQEIKEEIKPYHRTRTIYY